VRSVSTRYFKHGLEPNLSNAFDWSAARQAGNMLNSSRPYFWELPISCVDFKFGGSELYDVWVAL